jgi:tetratricopeptide (TPR) repeat protein
MSSHAIGVCRRAVLMLCIPVASALAQGPSPAEEQIAFAQKRLAADPSRYEAYNELALGFTRRARETSDTAYYDRAEEAIRASLGLAPDNFEAQKLRAWVLLGKHDFAGALDLARTLNKQVPNDVLVYGLLTDAHTELGNYKEAEEACQWMLDLRPGNIPALTRAAHLREIVGDIEGAIELMTSAYQRTVPTEVEDRAWILTQLAHLELMAGRIDNADRLLNDALTLFPNYHYALGNLAKVRSAQKRHADAVDLLKQRYAAAPHPENLYVLAEELERAGRVTDARAAYAEFEERARAEMTRVDNANRELIFYYADHAGKPAEALRVAELEVARRADVYTLDAYAWALHVNNRAREARQAIDRVLAVGLRDPVVLSRASAIATAANGAAPKR